MFFSPNKLVNSSHGFLGQKLWGIPLS
jgi:hypothetical protein